MEEEEKEVEEEEEEILMLNIKITLSNGHHEGPHLLHNCCNIKKNTDKNKRNGGTRGQKSMCTTQILDGIVKWAT